MPPEVLDNDEFDQSADVYAFGIILWQIYSLQEPFKGFDDWDEFYDAICINNLRPPIDKNCPDNLKSLIESCWSKDRKSRPLFSQIVNKIDDILVDISIQDVTSCEFWKKYYLVSKSELQEVVHWKDFTTNLCLSSGKSPEEKSRYEVLHPFLVSSGEGLDKEGKVTLQSFQNCINWFGSGFLRDPVKELEKIKILIIKQWFHGLIDQKEANGRLSFQGNRSFLVRLSKTLAEYPFTLSMNVDGQQRHLRIKKDKDFITEGDVFLVVGHENAYYNLIELIEGISPILGLKSPCPKKPAEDMYSGKVDDLIST